LEDADEPRLLRAVEDLRKGVPELIGILAELEGVERVVEPGETDDVEGRAREPRGDFDFGLAGQGRSSDLLKEAVFQLLYHL
jgi:hypothetical protein